jgi:4-amino-4-deoxy-L-arabinose transferase-like glycosyltransferase
LKASEHQGQLRLKSFASSGVDHPPTTSQPTISGVQKAREPEIENGHIILHRSPNFYVRTTNRRGQRSHPLRRRTGNTTLLPKVTPEQEQRIATSKTRMMPQIESINPIKAKAFSLLLLPAWLEAIVVAIGLIAAFVAHAFNIFNYPQYELDEGTYMSAAWAVLHGNIWPYPYGYGHPPLAWIQIAAWVQLTGGLFTFGNAINTGRVLMTFYAVGSSLLVYLIFRRLFGSRSGALFAMVIFSLSPLCITYQRQVLLDNVATFWLLLSLLFLVVGNSRLLFIVLSAISFGIALLSKEVLLLFFPAMIYAVWLHTTRFQRKFALVAFTYSVIAIGSSFVLMAFLRGELLPTGILPWDHHPHLNLFSTYIGQIQRGQNQGNMSVAWNAWTGLDSYLVMLSLAAMLFNLVAGWWNRKLLLLALLSISFSLLFLRNGVTFPFYIIPLLPLGAMNIAAMITVSARWIGKLMRFELLQAALIFLFIAGAIVYDAQISNTIYTTNLTSPQTKALAWIRNNVPHNAVVVINSYFFTDLHEEGGAGVGDGAIYPYAHVYWNVGFDPEIHDKLLRNDWNRIDYIVTDELMLRDIEHLHGGMDLVNAALQNASLVANFWPNTLDHYEAIQIYQVNHIHTTPIVGAGNACIAPLSTSIMGAMHCSITYNNDRKST